MLRSNSCRTLARIADAGKLIAYSCVLNERRDHMIESASGVKGNMVSFELSCDWRGVRPTFREL